MNEVSGHGPLHGLRVVGLEHSVAGPLCTRLFADLGADVIKIERPGRGDFARSWDTHAEGEGAQFWWLNRGKRSVALDLHDTTDRSLFDDLLATADVLVINLTPGATERLGLSNELLRTCFRRLTVCRISGFGATTSLRDRKAYDMLIQAEAGYLSLTGTPEAPARVGVSLCDVSTGMYAAFLALASVIEMRATGIGRDLDIAMIDVAAELSGPMLISYLNAGVLYERMGTQHHAIAPYGAFECADGRFIVLAVHQDDEWASLCTHVLDEPQLVDDPRFARNMDRVANRDAIETRIRRKFSSLDGQAAGALLTDARIGYAVSNDMKDVAEHPALHQREFFDTATSSQGKRVNALRALGSRLFGVNNARQRPPSLGEDTTMLQDELGTQSEARSLALESPTP